MTVTASTRTGGTFHVEDELETTIIINDADEQIQLNKKKTICDILTPPPIEETTKMFSMKLTQAMPVIQKIVKRNEVSKIFFL